MSAFYNASVAKWGEIAPKYRRPLPQSRIIGVKAVSNRRFAFKTAIPAIPYDQRMAHKTTKRRKRQIPKANRNRCERVAECKKAFAVSHREGFLFVRL